MTVSSKLEDSFSHERFSVSNAESLKQWISWLLVRRYKHGFPSLKDSKAVWFRTVIESIIQSKLDNSDEIFNNYISKNKEFVVLDFQTIKDVFIEIKAPPKDHDWKHDSQPNFLISGIKCEDGKYWGNYSIEYTNQKQNGEVVKSGEEIGELTSDFFENVFNIKNKRTFKSALIKKR